MGGIRLVLCAIALFACAEITNADPVAMHAEDLQIEYPNFNQKIAAIWQFASQNIAQLDPSNLQAPVIYFEAFDRTTESKGLIDWQNEWIISNPSVWLQWVTLKGIEPDQVTADYVRAHINELFPFPLTFRGFHYENTNRIQINPNTTFLAFYQNDPYGIQTDNVGYGYYVVGHEMTHFALATKGVPEELHHCIYVTSVGGNPSLMKRMATFLESKNISAPIVEMYGLGQEISLAPCNALTPAQRAEAVDYARKLLPADASPAQVAFAGG